MSLVDEAVSLRTKIESLPANSVGDVREKERLVADADERTARLLHAAGWFGDVPSWWTTGGYLGWVGREYDYMIDRHDPGMTAAAIARLFTELKSELVDYVSERLAEAVRSRDVCLLVGDSMQEATREAVRDHMQACWGRSHADLLVLHPPYADIIRFSDHPADLSNQETTEEFVAAFTRVANG